MIFPGSLHYVFVMSFKYCNALWAACAWASSTVCPVPWHTATGNVESWTKHCLWPRFKKKRSIWYHSVQGLICEWNTQNFSKPCWASVDRNFFWTINLNKIFYRNNVIFFFFAEIISLIRGPVQTQEVSKLCLGYLIMYLNK